MKGGWSGAARENLAKKAPLFLVAWAALAGATLNFSVVAGGFLLVGAMLFAPFRWHWWAVLGMTALVISVRLTRLLEPIEESLAEEGSRQVSGRLEVGQMLQNDSSERLGVFRSVEGRRRVLIVQADRYLAGDLLEVSGTLFVPGRNRNPGGFSQIEYWKVQGIHGGLKVHQEMKVGQTRRGWVIRQAGFLRAGLRGRISLGLPEESVAKTVIQAMVLGEKPPRSSPVSRAFRESGAMHVFAVSGLHVTMVGALAWFLLGFFPISRSKGFVAVLLVMIIYAFITGLRPPVLRATLMAACFLGAFYFRRRPALLNALSISFLISIFWSPLQIAGMGFQLSYGVLLAIIMMGHLIYGLTEKFVRGDSFLPMTLFSRRQRLGFYGRQRLGALWASSVAAWCGSIGLTLWHFGVVTPIATLASILLIPATMCVLGLAFLGVLVGLVFEPLAMWVNQLNGVVASSSYVVAREFSELPGAHVQVSKKAPADVIIFDTADGGGASLIDAGKVTLIDVGNEGFYLGELKGALNRWQLRPRVVLLTHPDGDHIGGISHALGEPGIEEVVVPVAKARSPAFKEGNKRAREVRAQWRVGEVGQCLDLGEGAVVEILYRGELPNAPLADNRGMVSRLVWKGWRVLFVGDLGIEDEEALLESGTDLSAEVVVMGMHDWGVSGQAHFIEAVGAKVVVVSSASFPVEKRVGSFWSAAMDEGGIKVFNQAVTGAVLVDFEDDYLELASFLVPENKYQIYR